MRSTRVRVTVGGTLLAVAVLVATEVRYSRARAERGEVVRIAAREYRKKFGSPAPPFRALPPGQVAHLDVRWDDDRHAYVVGFGHQALSGDSPRDYLFRPIPYRSGATTTHFFLVRKDGVCEYAGLIAGGSY